MSSPKELQEKRLRFLHCLYNLTAADRTKTVKLETIAQKAGISAEDAIIIGQYLHDEKLIGQFLFRKGKLTTFLKYAGSITPKELDSYGSTWDQKRPISITHKGIKEMEQALTYPNKPTEHFPSITINNYINNSGMVTNQNIQQGTVDSNQTIVLNSFQRDELQQIINQMKEIIQDKQITPDQKQQLELEVATLELQSKSPKPIIKRIAESLSSAKEIFDTISACAAIATRIGTLLSGFHVG